MLRCADVRILFALFAFALVVRALLFGLHPDAAYPDSYYYVDVARALQAGHGFNIDFIYSFLDVGGRIPPNPTLPIPSNGFWMPLASIVQVPTMWLLGPTALASALPFILVGSLAAPLTWLVAREIGCRPAVALAAGIAVASPAAWGRLRAWRSGGARTPAIPWRYALACLGLFLLAMAPWYLRQLAVFGSLSPSSGSGSVFFIQHYDDIERVGGDISLTAYLGQGLVPLLTSRLVGLAAALGIFAVLARSLALAPFVVVGGWAHIVAPLAPVIESVVRPSWLGPPIFVIPYTWPRTGDPAADSAPALAIYPVCIAATDTRCGAAPATAQVPGGAGIEYLP